MKKLIILFILISNFTMESQTIDSVKLIPSNPALNDTIDVRMFFSVSNTGNQISRFKVYHDSDTTEIHIYWKYCLGYTVLSNFDTLIKISPLNTGTNYLKYIKCADTNRVNSSCYIVDEVDCFDTIKTTFNVIQSVNNIGKEANIIIQPNPITEYVKISIPEKYNSGYIELIDMYGRKLKTIFLENKESEITLYREGIKSGIYFLRITLDNNQRFTKKLVMK